MVRELRRPLVRRSLAHENMNQLTTCLLIVVLVGCAPEPGPEPEPARVEWKRMEDRDSQLRAQFEKITIGMSRATVRDLMEAQPDVIRENLWGFKLSRASDTRTEIDWTFLVVFKDGKVSKMDMSYTCVYWTLRE